MTNLEKDTLLRRYAAGEIIWSSLRQRGFDNYLDVLTGLGDRGLRQPLASMDGYLSEARARGRAYIREALRTAR